MSTTGSAALARGYRSVRENVTGWLTECPGAADAPVPCCPGWSVRDVVAHLVDVCGRFGGLPGTGRPADDTGKLLTAWAEAAAPVERELGAGTAGTDGRAVMDAVTHECDIREALGIAPPVGHPGFGSAFRVVVGGLGASLGRHGLAAVTIKSPVDAWVAGQGEPGVTWSGGHYELLRALCGRRSHAQISAMAWSRAPEPWLPAFTWGPFFPPGTARP
ncbi:maleylpyruvate isomerase N-terminal domain-containing protein [Streptomyces sp. NPDC047002]|uniref:maleylpyruvate isomerase N-terminal domain-containing protein n=1 Tax=Streptomyces sp. NPDC047002 TaxID=3155475 RepID=UPI003452FD36